MTADISTRALQLAQTTSDTLTRHLIECATENGKTREQLRMLTKVITLAGTGLIAGLFAVVGFLILNMLRHGGMV